MANICDSEIIIRASQEILEKLNNTLDELCLKAPLGKSIPMANFLDKVGVRSDDIRGLITYYDLDNDKLKLDTESKWTPMDDALRALNKSFDNKLTISRRAIEPGCDLYWVCDPCDDFPEECYVIDYINGESDVMAITDAIDNWCKIVGVSRDGRSDNEMVVAIYGYNNEIININKSYEIHEFKREDDNYFNKMKQINNTYEIEIPFFPGFCNSALMDSYRLYEIASEMSDETGKDINADDLNIDTKAYTEACCEAFVKAFKKRMPSVIEGLESYYSYSPKEYNFHNNRLYTFATFIDGWQDEVLEFINDNEEWLEKRIKADWTYGNFISFLPNTLNEWKTELSKDNPDPSFTGVMISYMMLREHENIELPLIEDVLEEVNIKDYVSLNK